MNGIKEGIEQERKQMKEQIREQKLEIAKKLLNKNMTTEEICEITGIEKEEIEKLEKK